MRRVLNVKEAAAALRVSTCTLYRMVARGEIGCVRSRADAASKLKGRAAGIVLFLESDIEDWLLQHHSTPTREAARRTGETGIAGDIAEIRRRGGLRFAS